MPTCNLDRSPNKTLWLLTFFYAISGPRANRKKKLRLHIGHAKVIDWTRKKNTSTPGKKICTKQIGLFKKTNWTRESNYVIKKTLGLQLALLSPLPRTTIPVSRGLPSSTQAPPSAPTTPSPSAPEDASVPSPPAVCAPMLRLHGRIDSVKLASWRPLRSPAEPWASCSSSPPRLRPSR
jgi:hypothetical protein